MVKVLDFVFWVGLLWYLFWLSGESRDVVCVVNPVPLNSYRNRARNESFQICFVTGTLLQTESSSTVNGVQWQSVDF